MADKKKKINSALSAVGRATSKANSNVADQLKKKKKSAQQAAQMQESQKKLPSWYGSIDTSKPITTQKRSTTSAAKGRSVFAPQQQTTTQTTSPAGSTWPIVPKKSSAGLPSLSQVYGAPYRSDLAAYLPSSAMRGTVDPAKVSGAHYAEWMSDMADQKAYDEYRQQMLQSAKPQMKYQQHYNFETDRKRVERLEYQLRFENNPEERQRMQGEIDTILASAGTQSPEANEYAKQYYQEKQDRADRSADRRRAQANAATTIVDQIRSGNYDWSRESDEGEQRLVAGLQTARESGNQTAISAYERALEEYRKNPGLYAGNTVSDEEKQATANRYLKRSDMLSDLTQEAIGERDAARRGVYQSKANQYYLDMDKKFGFTAASQQPDFKEKSIAPSDGFTYQKAITVNGNPMVINQPFETDYHWDYMTDDEKATAYYLYNTKGEGTAKAYMLDYLGPGIDKVYSQDQQAKIYDEVSNASGWEKALYSGASVITNAVYAPMSYLNNAGQVVGNLIADKRGVGWTPVNSYGEFSQAARNTRISRQAVADSMGSVGAFFYQTGMSMLDNMILMPTGEAGTLGLMALEAADAQYAEDIDNGVDPETAAISGAIAGGIETLTETVSLEHLFKAPDVESFLRGLGKQALFEGSEEGASDVLNLIRERALYGETSYGTTEEEHKAWFKQLLLDIAGGAVSGAGMYAGYGGPQYVARRIGETKASGQQVLANDNGAALAQAYTDATGRPANEPKSVFQTGRVLQKTLNQGAKNYNATYAQETGDAAVQYFQDNQPKGQEADKKASETVYAAIRKTLAGKKLTRQERAAMGSIPGVREAVAAYQQGGAMEGTVNREGSAKIKRGMENALLSVDRNLQSAGLDSNVGTEIKTTERMQQTAQGVQEAAQERKAMMQMREGENTQSQVDGQDVELLGMTGVGDKATLNVRNQDGQVQEVSLNDVTYGSDRKATAYAIGADMENTALANSFVATLADNQVPARVAAGMQAAYDYAYGGAPSVESLKGSILTEGLNDAQLNRAFELGQQARQTAVRVAQETKMKQALKQANVEWKGGTVDTSKVDMASLNAEQQRQVNLVQLVAGVTGMNVELFQSKADANGRYLGENGSYNATTNTIRLDVNAGANNAGELSQVTLLRTMSHELTHALQQNSPAQYEALKNAVLDTLTSKSGASIEEMAARKMEQDSSLKDNGAALDEVVAEACENMLRDSDAMEQLIAQHPAEAKTFLEKVKQFFTDIVNAIRAAFGGSGTSRSREATALMQQAEEYLDICEKWSKALQETAEISGRSVFYDDGGQPGDTQYSMRVTDEDTLEFLNNQDTVTTYKTMQLVDGKLYPPMAAVVAGNYEDASVLGQWEQAVEHPELVKNGKFTLNKGKGQGTIAAAYNPYMHSSNLVLNDQFSGAYTRPNLVTVECQVPVSELTSGYRAQYAKDSVGWHEWHTGTVAGALRKATGTERQVLLSRYIKPVRIVSNAETAGMYKALLDGTGISVPDNVVSPGLLEELRKVGVPIKKSGRIKDGDVQYSLRDETYLAAVEDGDLQKAQAMVDEAARQAGYTRKLYHGTQYQFNQFMRGGEGIHLGTFEAADFVRRNRASGENQGRMIEAYVRLDNPMYVPYDIQRWDVENLRDLIFAANGLQTSKELLATTADGQQIDLDFSQVEGIPQITKKAPRPARNIQADEDFGTSRRKSRRGAAVQTERATTTETNRVLSDEEQLSRMKTFDEIAEWLKARGIDGIEYTNAIEDKNSTSVLVFDSNQVKLADAVTYDDQGDVIPLSERFDRGNEDIRYSVRDYSYEELTAKPDMAITSIDTSRNIDRDEAIRLGRENVLKYADRFNPNGTPMMYVNDLGKYVVVGKKGLEHGLDRRVAQQSSVIANIGDILNNSIVVNEAHPKREGVKNTWILLGMATDSNGTPVYVRSVVNQSTNELEEVNSLYSVYGKKSEAGRSVAAYASGKSIGAPSSSTITIAELLNGVKEKFSDVLPDDVVQKLGIERVESEFTPRLKYSLRENDRKYMDAVEQGNTAEAQKLVDAAAKAAGYKNLFYHGAKKGGGFTTFRGWSYFTENKGYAQRYSEAGNANSLYTTYVKMERPFDTRIPEVRDLFDEARMEYGMGQLQDTGLPDWTDGYDLSEYIEENDLPYDGIVLDEGGDFVNGKPVSRGLSYVIRNSAQIKSADAVTYDDNGKVIPLSERFNSESDDIRYQMRDEEGGDQGLVGMFDETPRLGEAHIDQRTWENMSDRRVHSFFKDPL